MSEAQLATILFAAPFLTLCAGGIVAQVFVIRAEIVRLREIRAHVAEVRRAL